jgi:hypothetical protein
MRLKKRIKEKYNKNDSFCAFRLESAVSQANEM